MLSVCRQNVYHQVQLSTRHSFYNKSVIVREEKETTWAASTLPRLEYHISVVLWVQGFLKQHCAQICITLYFLEVFELVHCYEDLSFHNFVLISGQVRPLRQCQRILRLKFFFFLSLQAYRRFRQGFLLTPAFFHHFIRALVTPIFLFNPELIKRDCTIGTDYLGRYFFDCHPVEVRIRTKCAFIKLHLTEKCHTF